MRIVFILNIFTLLLLAPSINGQITWDVDEGCVPLQVRFAIDTSLVDISAISTAEWNFANGETVTANATDTVLATYLASKLYEVILTLNDGRVFTRFYNGVLPELNSYFEAIEEDEPDYTYTFEPKIDLSDTNASYTFTWEHFQNGTSLRRITNFVDYTNPEDAIEQFTYPDTGNYVVELGLVQNKTAYNCESSNDTNLAIFDEFEVGNVFSPTSSDYFIIDPENSRVILSFILFGRTGIKIFEQEAEKIFWDGRNFSGQEMGTGVYFYVIKATQGDPTGEYYSKTGFIHLFR